MIIINSSVPKSWSKTNVVNNVNDFFNLNLGKTDLEDIFNRFDEETTMMHNYNKGTFDRYKTEMSKENLKKCETTFREYLEDQGYLLDSHY